MKLKNIMLVSAGIISVSTVFAASNPLPAGKTYVGFTGGWGQVDYDTDSSAYFTPGGGSTPSGPADIQSGGFAGRAYVGYLVPVSALPNWSFGPEIGYSFYPQNTYTEINPSYDVIVKEKAYGVDMLLNINYNLTNTLSLFVKPGMQYAVQKDTAQDNLTTAALPPSASSNKLEPEINLGVNWQVTGGTPLFLGASYQYVSGDSSIGTLQRLSTEGSSYASVTAREIYGINLEYMFN